jgi:ferrous iron transport protein A
LIRIDQLTPGQPATIADINRDGCDATTWQRLHEMGFDEGVDVELLHRAPFGGPVAIRVGNMTIALRPAEAALITVDPLPHTNAAA